MNPLLPTSIKALNFSSTGLRKLNSLLEKKAFMPLYVDLYATRSLTHLAQKLSSLLYDNKILHQSRLRKILGSLGASFSFDPLTGNPLVNFNVTERSAVLKSIPELLKLLSDTKMKAVIAFDEFQEVANYEEDFAEATIRTYMQEFLLPDLQWRTVTAIAREGYVKALLDKGLIIDTGDKGLRVYNDFY